MRCIIVLPCFNEERNLKPLVQRIDNALKSRFPYEIIAVDDGSFDGTSKVLKELSVDFPIKILKHPLNMGLGAALRTGLLAAIKSSSEKDLIITMDSDNTHDPKQILNMIEAAERADLIIGSRYVKNGGQIHVPSYRIFLSKTVNFLIAKFFNIPIKDSTSGFRCFKAYLLKKLHRNFGKNIIESNGFEASFELLLKALRLGASTVELPIWLDYKQKLGDSKMNIFSTILNYLQLFLKLNKLNGLKHFSVF